MIAKCCNLSLLLAACLVIAWPNAANGGVRPGDEEMLMVIATEMAAREQTFKTASLQIMQKVVKGGVVSSAIEWNIWIEGKKIASERKRIGDDGGKKKIVSQFNQSIQTPEFFVVVTGSTPDTMIGGSWYELQGNVIPTRAASYISMLGPPNPLAEASKLGSKPFADPQKLLFGDSTVWQVDEMPAGQGLVLVTRKRLDDVRLEDYTVDIERGFFVVQHNSYSDTGKVIFSQTIELARFGETWFPSTLTTKYLSGNEHSLVCLDARFNDPVAPERFDARSLKCANGTIVTHHYLSGHQEGKMWVNGGFFDYATARQLLVQINADEKPAGAMQK